jgi:putative oxidoreductase
MNDNRQLKRRVDWRNLAFLYARATLGIAFLSGIADRFGLWRGRNVGYGNFDGFIRYTAKVNSFMPASSIPFLAWSATIAEFVLGIFLLIGAWLRWTALASALLLILFGTAMAISFGPKSPLDYSVFSASAAAVLLALNERRASGTQSSALGIGTVPKGRLRVAHSPGFRSERRTSPARDG